MTRESIGFLMRSSPLVLGLGAAVLCLVPGPLAGYPKRVEEAREFGAKDCTFCHTRARGSSGWNKRGQYLIREKTRRSASQIDVDWLRTYKPKPSSSSNRRVRSRRRLAPPAPIPTPVLPAEDAGNERESAPDASDTSPTPEQAATPSSDVD